jgi:FHA domain
MVSDVLTGDPDRADALVDLSNVLRNTALGGPGPANLIRLERVAQALATLYGSTAVAMFGVADRSLLAGSMFPDAEQRRRVHQWAASGLIAEETGLPIITGDRFVGHRREFNWLDGSDDAILEPGTGHGGEVFLRHVTLAPQAVWDQSMREEHDLLVQQGLSRRIEALGRYWSCPEPRCPRHDPVRSPFVLLPLARGSRLVCDQHGLEMTDLGPRPRVAQLKVMRDGRERQRFTVGQGQPVTVGRSPTGIDLSPLLDEADRRRISREHLRFELDSEKLMVTDLSRNGTTLVLRDGTRLDFRHTTHPFTVGDRAQVRPGLEIIRSGRRYPAELPHRTRSSPRPGELPPDLTATS